MGPWRSPVAHLHGMQGVRGSNPLGSTKTPDERHLSSGVFVVFGPNGPDWGLNRATLGAILVINGPH